MIADTMYAITLLPCDSAGYGCRMEFIAYDRLSSKYETHCFNLTSRLFWGATNSDSLGPFRSLATRPGDCHLDQCEPTQRHRHPYRLLCGLPGTGRGPGVAGNQSPPGLYSYRPGRGDRPPSELVPGGVDRFPRSFWRRGVSSICRVVATGL